ncbi:Threonine synthase [invertebrate metagenome]|uniref:Threonine synthase n=1 Tax=invertebrate metagenome TaxID=1711999 RepID=A0A484HD39_9ZZZZ
MVLWGRVLRYVSTRGLAPALTFEDVLLTGLARDGGLYVPELWPVFCKEELLTLSRLSYPELAIRVIRPFIGTTLTESELADIVWNGCKNFRHPAVAPLKQLDCNGWVCELFHGPTLAFKDYALQFLGPLFDHILQQSGKRVVLVGATSGDTGSAAIEAFRDRAAVDVFVLHPHERVSSVQRRQMTTVQADNIHNIAVTGTFDDCQALVKRLLNDVPFRESMNLSAVNSINWGRLIAQVVYYFWSALAIGGCSRQIAFAVPTGNFGNVFAGYVARAMGLPVSRFVIGSNCNDILTRFFATGTMSVRPVVPTLSPSMDIQVSSNFERLLFEMYNRDGAIVERLMTQFQETGVFSVANNCKQEIRDLFCGFALNDDETKATMAEVYTTTGALVDPHTAIGIAAARASLVRSEMPVITLSTAHPAKFPLATREATGQEAVLPAHLDNLFVCEERFIVLPADLAVVQQYIRLHARR